jgi:hypothetical protein
VLFWGGRLEAKSQFAAAISIYPTTLYTIKGVIELMLGTKKLRPMKSSNKIKARKKEP